ncbi:MAG: hypothetical protein ABIO04_08225 [Ferruginibacter sp.]
MNEQAKVKGETRFHTFNIFNDNATKDKIYRHLNDINDTITEEDIRNIKVSIPSTEIPARTNSKFTKMN